MAKDPAFLFYPGDYIAGTMHLDFECKGAYMDLLMLQFQKDHMTLHMIRQVLGHMYERVWPLICDKFKENDGRFWNQRLKEEKDKRIKFCKSRKDNKNKNKHMLNHMSQHMENENNCINNEDKLISDGESKTKYSGNFKARGEEVLAKRLADNLAAANGSRKKDNKSKA